MHDTRRVVYDHQIFGLQRYGGISRYFCELAARIHGSRGFTAKLLAPIHFNKHLRDSEAPKWAVHADLNVRGFGRVLRTANRSIAPVATRALSPSLVHRTYYDPFDRGSHAPCQIVTVFDMIHELFPAAFPAGDPTIQRKRLSVQRADHVICISESTAKDLRNLLDIPPEKISVTHLGFSDTFAGIDQRGGISPHPRPYLLYVGHRDGYKNFEGALRAYASEPRLRDEFDFLTFGGHPFSARERLVIADLALRPDSVVRRSGGDDELARLYRHARAFVYPSQYEGFGIPPLEAMSAGCVVACSNTSSIPEVVGDAALLFDPSDQEQMVDALVLACFDEGTRSRMLAAGRERLLRFSWERCAQQTLDAYELALGSSRR
jgi:glycosyltransferase involved in cell wall biosynthesis